MDQQDLEEELIAGKFKPSDVVKFGGLMLFFALVGTITYLVGPSLYHTFQEEGVQGLVSELRDSGVKGFLTLMMLQFIQIVVAFIPGEITEVAAGIIYGPWLGLLVILLGCIISSALIFLLVRKLGAPFVQALVPMNFREKLLRFDESGKLDMTVFILFLIPGLPKDAFTYLCPLTSMSMKHFMLISNLGRVPGIFMVTFAANDLISGHYIRSIVIFIITAALAILGIVFQDKISDVIEKVTKRRR